MPNETKYSLTIRGQQYGPFGLRRLQEFVDQGQIEPTATLLSTDGHQIQASAVPGLRFNNAIVVNDRPDPEIIRKFSGNAFKRRPETPTLTLKNRAKAYQAPEGVSPTDTADASATDLGYPIDAHVQHSQSATSKNIPTVSYPAYLHNTSGQSSTQTDNIPDQMMSDSPETTPDDGSPEHGARNETENSLPPGERLCPYCAERIKVAAIKCKHCREWLSSAAGDSDRQKRDGSNSSTRSEDNGSEGSPLENVENAAEHKSDSKQKGLLKTTENADSTTAPLSYFVVEKDEKIGPYNIEQLQKLVDFGKLHPATIVERSGGKTSSANRVAGLNYDTCFHKATFKFRRHEIDYGPYSLERIHQFVNNGNLQLNELLKLGDGHYLTAETVVTGSKYPGQAQQRSDKVEQMAKQKSGSAQGKNGVRRKSVTSKLEGSTTKRQILAILAVFSLGVIIPVLAASSDDCGSGGGGGGTKNTVTQKTGNHKKCYGDNNLAACKKVLAFEADAGDTEGIAKAMMHMCNKLDVAGMCFFIGESGIQKDPPNISLVKEYMTKACVLFRKKGDDLSKMEKKMRIRACGAAFMMKNAD